MASEKFETIRVEEWFEGGVLAVTLDHPKGNVLSSAMIDEIQTVVDGLQARPSCKAFVLGAAGRHFSFGASVEEHKADEVGDMLPRFHRLIRSVVDLDVPSIVGVKGQCLGGALELVLAFDMVFAAESARLGVPEITLGVFPPPAGILLPFKIPAAAAQEMILTGDTWEASRLYSLGLVSKVVGDDDLDAAVRGFVEAKLIGKSASSLRLANRATKRVVRDLMNQHLDAIERLYLDDLMKTRDANEGIQAFLEKRKPTWENG